MEEERLDVGHDQPRPAAPEELAVQLLQPGSDRRHRSWTRVDQPATSSVVVQVLRRRRADRRRRRSRAAPSCVASPIPESSSSFGDSIVPAQTTTSCSARTVSTPPLARELDADAAPALEQQARARRAGQHREVRARPATGPRKASPWLWRRPSLIISCANADPVQVGAVVVRVERDPGLLRCRRRRRRDSGCGS